MSAEELITTIIPREPNSGTEFDSQFDKTMISREPDIDYNLTTPRRKFTWIDYREYLLTNIVNANLASVKLVCEKLNLKYMGSDTAYILLNECLDFCRRLNRQTIGRYLIEYWDATAGGGLDTILECLGRTDINDDNIYFMIQLYPARSFASFVIDMAERYQGQFQEIAVPRLYNHFKHILTIKVVRDLVDVAARMRAGQTAHQMRWVLGELSRQLDTNWAPKPKYIANFISDKPESAESIRNKKLTSDKPESVENITLENGLSIESIMLENGLFVNNQNNNNITENLTQDQITPKILLSNSDLQDLTELYLALYPNHPLKDYTSLAYDWRINRVPPNIREAVIALTAGIRPVVDSMLEINNLAERASVQKSIIQDYEYANEEERYSMMLPVWRIEIGKSLENDMNLFHLFGPANPHTGTNFPIDKVGDVRNCSIYGGCRMLLCKCYADTLSIADEDTDLGDIEAEATGKRNFSTERDWFTGKCDKCGQIIRHKSWAVRKPVGNGGWKGCFCEWSCVKSMIPNFEDRIMEEESWEHIQMYMVSVCEQQCNKYGIQDYN